MSTDGGLWYVKMADGDVDAMSLDELDEAFNADRIDQDTMVLPAGELHWQRLGTLLGLDSPAPAPAPAPPPTPMPVSLRPVSFDLGADLDLDAPSPFRSRSRKPLYGAAGLALVLGLVAFVSTRGGADPARASAAAAAPPHIAAAAAAAPAPPPVVPAPEATPPSPAPDTRFSADQKAKLAAADKVLADKVAAHKKAKGAAVAKHGAQAKYKSQGFTTGGSKFDPMNAAP